MKKKLLNGALVALLMTSVTIGGGSLGSYLYGPSGISRAADTDSGSGTKGGQYDLSENAKKAIDKADTDLKQVDTLMAELDTVNKDAKGHTTNKDAVDLASQVVTDMTKLKDDSERASSAASVYMRATNGQNAVKLAENRKNSTNDAIINAGIGPASMAAIFAGVTIKSFSDVMLDKNGLPYSYDENFMPQSVTKSEEKTYTGLGAITVADGKISYSDTSVPQGSVPQGASKNRCTVYDHTKGESATVTYVRDIVDKDGKVLTSFDNDGNVDTSKLMGEGLKVVLHIKTITVKGDDGSDIMAYNRDADPEGDDFAVSPDYSSFTRYITKDSDGNEDLDFTAGNKAYNKGQGNYTDANRQYWVDASGNVITKSIITEDIKAGADAITEDEKKQIGSDIANAASFLGLKLKKDESENWVNDATEDEFLKHLAYVTEDKKTVTKREKDESVSNASAGTDEEAKTYDATLGKVNDAADSVNTAYQNIEDTIKNLPEYTPSGSNTGIGCKQALAEADKTYQKSAATRTDVSKAMDTLRLALDNARKTAPQSYMNALTGYAKAVKNYRAADIELAKITQDYYTSEAAKKELADAKTVLKDYDSRFEFAPDTVVLGIKSKADNAINLANTYKAKAEEKKKTATEQFLKYLDPDKAGEYFKVPSDDYPNYTALAADVDKWDDIKKEDSSISAETKEKIAELRKAVDDLAAKEAKGETPTASDIKKFTDALNALTSGTNVKPDDPGTVDPSKYKGYDLNGDGKTDAFDTNGDKIPDAWDTDKDGIPDVFDTDKDGIADKKDTDKDGKADAPYTPQSFDTDKNGKADAWDNNGDGKADAFDTNGDDKVDGWDTDGDGKPDIFDTDGDGTIDAWDTKKSKDGKPDAFDTNKDGKIDAWDTNGDGKIDSWDTNGDGNVDAFDSDGDGIPDRFDTNGDSIWDAYDTNKDGKPDAFDTNGDGKVDAWDTNGDGKPNVFDTDGDGKPDMKDTNGDGKPDTKINGGSDKTDPDTPDTTSKAYDTNGDGIPDAWDANGDGKIDSWDTNDDGKPDVFDTDGDGKPDMKDTNGDGKPDTKISDNTNPSDPSDVEAIAKARAEVEALVKKLDDAKERATRAKANAQVYKDEGKDAAKWYLTVYNAKNPTVSTQAAIAAKYYDTELATAKNRYDKAANGVNDLNEKIGKLAADIKALREKHIDYTNKRYTKFPSLTSMGSEVNDTKIRVAAYNALNKRYKSNTARLNRQTKAYKRFIKNIKNNK